MNYLMCYFVYEDILLWYIVCDIAEMYLRIELNPDDRSFHRFLWRNLASNEKPCE